MATKQGKKPKAQASNKPASAQKLPVAKKPAAPKKADEYVALARALDSKAKLLQFWKDIQARTTPGWQSGKALEYLVVRAFEFEGAAVVWPFSVRDAQTNEELEQIDGVVYAEGISAIVEAKDFEDKVKVNIEPIAKLRSQLLRRPSGVVGAVFSRTGFTDPAVQLAPFTAPQTVVLWGPEDLDRALNKSKMIAGLEAKYRRAVEKTLPNYDLALEAW